MMKRKRKPVIYIAGPYSNPDPVENTHNAYKIADSLMDVCSPMVPHSSLMQHLIYPRPYGEWLEHDLNLVDICHALLRIPGESSGADKEVVHAKRRGIPVFTDVDELRKWCREWPAPEFEVFFYE